MPGGKGQHSDVVCYLLCEKGVQDMHSFLRLHKETPKEYVRCSYKVMAYGVGDEESKEGK